MATVWDFDWVSDYLLRHNLRGFWLEVNFKLYEPTIKDERPT